MLEVTDSTSGTSTLILDRDLVRVRFDCEESLEDPGNDVSCRIRTELGEGDDKTGWIADKAPEIGNEPEQAVLTL